MVEGPGIVGGQAERQEKFTIRAKDAHGNFRTDGGDDFKVVIEGATSETATVSDNGIF